ncbi:LRR receptor-like serine/threonine-protein kinase EFR [Senna tora]|uniref:LRR receptor-like serine/threonine-protein kinase EFR n=1 Tax=Senna tora TaxID=362788 RepID=A0A834TFG8_9FABA|nr:LRR receptor-like serine/threonine-protein kinase EFR [Senna tora]
MAEEETLREHQAPLCIATPTLQALLELKSGLIHLLPKFIGLMNEDPYQHMKKFHVVCSSMKPKRVTKEQIKLRAFPFSLDGAAKEWLFYLHAGSVTSWEGMMRLFLYQYFASSKVINMRRDICGIKQMVTESLFGYWEQFKKLCASCPQHDIPEQSLLHYFYEGLSSTERSKLPSQTEMNQRQNVTAITLRSGKDLEEPIRKRSCGRGLGVESEPETEVVMKKPTEDVYEGTFSMEFDGEVVKFNAMKRPNEISSVCKVGVINPIVQESLELHQQDKLGNMVSESIDQVCLEKPKEDPNSDEVQEEVACELEALKPKLGDPTPHDLNSSHTITSPLVMQESELKLKQLPNYLKYAFLEVQVKEEKLVRMLGDRQPLLPFPPLPSRRREPLTLHRYILLHLHLRHLPSCFGHQHFFLFSFLFFFPSQSSSSSITTTRLLFALATATIVAAVHPRRR